MLYIARICLRNGYVRSAIVSCTIIATNGGAAPRFVRRHTRDRAKVLMAHLHCLIWVCYGSNGDVSNPKEMYVVVVVLGMQSIRKPRL